MPPGGETSARELLERWLREDLEIPKAGPPTAVALSVFCERWLVAFDFGNGMLNSTQLFFSAAATCATRLSPRWC